MPLPGLTDEVVRGRVYPQDAGRRQRKRVLVVDDEPMVTDWLKMVIEQAPSEPGFEVRIASHGARAEEVYQTWHPSVVFLDLLLPDTDGIALLRKMKAVDPVPEIIVISGQRPHQEGAGGRAGGSVLFRREV